MVNRLHFKYVIFLQVREQERQFARKVRNDVRQRKAVELKVLSEQLEDGWVKEQNEKAVSLRQLFEKNLEHIGEGHRAAANQVEWSVSFGKLHLPP